ncbi:MAG: helix-turn-helix domain-containing protein [Nitrososphaerales archaeon]
MSDGVNPKPRRTSARDRTAALLADAARAQLLDEGEMTVTAVAERAGVSRATAYRYLVNNDAVTLWATMPIVNDVAASADTGAGLEAAFPEKASPADRAELLVRQRGGWAFDHERELRAILSACLVPDSQMLRKGVLSRGQWIEESLLRHLPDHVNEKERLRLALALTPLFGSDLVVWARDAADLPTDEALDLIAWMARSLVEATIARAKRGTKPST